MTQGRATMLLLLFSQSYDSLSIDHRCNYKFLYLFKKHLDSSSEEVSCTVAVKNLWSTKHKTKGMENISLGNYSAEKK